MKYMFFDDYSEGVHPEILKYISEHNFDQQVGYCDDDYCKQGADCIKKAFDAPEADVHYIPNGTIANVIGLVSMLKPFEAVVAPASGHINVHEAGALEATGHKILWVDTPDGKLTPALIDKVTDYQRDEHTVLPRAVYLTQATELGTTYTKEELSGVIKHAKDKGLYVYLDGARLAMAIANDSLGFTTQDIGNLGLDMFYIGGLKNGGLYGEAMVILNDELKKNFRNHLKQRGGLMAKGRFMGQQYIRFFGEDNLWLSLAEHANAQAMKLYKGLKELGVEFDLEPGTNQIFPILHNETLEKLRADYGYHAWEKVGGTKTKIRLVCSWSTPADKVDGFLVDVKAVL